MLVLSPVASGNLTVSLLMVIRREYFSSSELMNYWAKCQERI
jgi:hypothetical protein